jgi:septal ring factor EnvC (AmiA/AmiB activator)
MIEYYEEQLDLTKNRIVELEKNLSVMHENIMTVAEQIKETQMFLIKLAKNQAEMSKRLSQWPYIDVPSREEGDE